MRIRRVDLIQCGEIPVPKDLGIEKFVGARHGEPHLIEGCLRWRCHATEFSTRSRSMGECPKGWGQASASCRSLMGCRFQYVSERQHHSSGPKRKWLSQIGLQMREKIHMPRTT